MYHLASALLKKTLRLLATRNKFVFASETFPSAKCVAREMADFTVIIITQ